MPQAIRTSRKALVLRVSQFPDLPEAPHPRREVRMRDNSKMTRTMCGNSVAAHYLGSNDPDLNAPFLSERVRKSKILQATFSFSDDSLFGSTHSSRS
jgi:hypothetical protein